MELEKPAAGYEEADELNRCAEQTDRLKGIWWTGEAEDWL